MVTPAANLCDVLVDAFLAAYQASAVRDETRTRLMIGRGSIDVLSASPPLSSALMPSLESMLDSNGSKDPADLTLHMWSGPHDAPQVGSLYDECLKYPDTVTVFNQAPLHLQYNPVGEILSLIDTSRRLAFYYAPDPCALPDYEVCTPMRMILNWFCTEMGMRFVHAAAIGFEGIGVLLVGVSGSGKSTTALTCLLEGLDFVGDDYIALSGSGPFIAHSLYRGCKVMDDALVRLPRMQNWLIETNATQDKNVAILNASAGHLARSLPIKAIVRPQVAMAHHSSFTPTSAISIVVEFAGSTLLQMPGVGESMLRDISTICRALPTFHIQLSSDPEEIANAMRSFILTMQGAGVESPELA